MIKIKDYIFNENEIREIKQCKNYLRLDLTYSGPYLCINDATFEDIEWNYENFNDCKQLEEIILVRDKKIKELEEENKKLKKPSNYYQYASKLVKNNCESLQQKIDKAIEYIEKSINNPQPFYEYIIGDENGNVQNLDKLLKILKGEE